MLQFIRLHIKNSRLLFKKIQTLRANNWRTHRIHYAKFSGYYFYINTNIYRDFQICISVPVSSLWRKILNRVILAQLNTSALRIKFDLLAEGIKRMFWWCHKVKLGKLFHLDNSILKDSHTLQTWSKLSWDVYVTVMCMPEGILYSV